MLQQDRTGWAQKTAIRVAVAIKRLQKLDQPGRVIRQLLTGEREEKRQRPGRMLQCTMLRCYSAA